jgi:prepilin-type N-terminal cleavage/methylation domain-containing protein
VSTGGQSADRPRRSADHGFSLIEVLIAVSLLSMAVVGVLPLVWANVRGSSLQDELAKARGWVVTAGDYATATAADGGLAYTDCASASSYQGLLQAWSPSIVPSGFSATDLTVTSVQYWDGNNFGPTCYAATNLKLQMISLQVASPDGRATEKLDVVKDG